MASSNNQRTTPTGGSANDRPRLTDAEKKQNHILSEQKRRQAIRQGFDRLAAQVPGCEGMGRSEALVLQATVNEMKAQTALKEKLKKKIMRDNPDMTEDLFNQFYEPHSTGVPEAVFCPPQANSPAASTGSGSGKGKGKKVKTETE
ncbi:hypothetical protein WHR41_01692 [Cladosporium halotolerans]|uniref:BHLH domain-containing protein n=1 Tax=Cladosporium halotolerans TaxID=1052096 RepID=A0AB34L236_9PEZI